MSTIKHEYDASSNSNASGIGSEKTTNLTSGTAQMDACPLSLGINTLGEVMTKLISRSTLIPAKKFDMFTTVVDKQSTVAIQVYEGERSMTKDNHFLGKFDLTGIPPAPRGVPQIEVTFEIDVNGILHVSAEDKGTGNYQRLEINYKVIRLKSNEIQRMVDDAVTFAAADKQAKKEAVARSELESFAYWICNSLNDKENGTCYAYEYSIHYMSIFIRTCTVYEQY